MESESIVDYLKSSLGKPWPLIANSSQNLTILTTATTTKTTPIPLQQNNTNSTSPNKTHNHTNSPTINGKSHLLETSLPAPLSPIRPPSLTPSESATSNHPGENSNCANVNENQTNGTKFCANHNHSDTQLDGLYPEWDEFYLLVCDICGIIIRPQALEKHLATKHRINVQTNQNHTLPINNKTSDSKSSGKDEVTNDHKNSSNSSGQNNINSSISNFTKTSTSISNEELPIDSSTSAKPVTPTANSIATYDLNKNFTHDPNKRHRTTARWYLDRKWRNTFNVLKDAFF